MGYTIYCEIPKERKEAITTIISALPTPVKLFPDGDRDFMAPSFDSRLDYRRRTKPKGSVQCGYNYSGLGQPDRDYLYGVIACVALHLGLRKTVGGIPYAYFYYDHEVTYLIHPGQATPTDNCSVVLPNGLKDDSNLEERSLKLMADAEDRARIIPVLDELSATISSLRATNP